MHATDPYHLRELTRDDIPAGMHLKTLSNWNQTRDDWKFLIHYPGAYHWAATANRQVVGTICNLPFDSDMGWIGMLLVHPDHRRQGLGTKLLQKVLSCATQNSFRLDATPEGSKLYETLGFNPVGAINRWICDGLLDHQPENLECGELMRPNDLGKTIDYDMKIMGFNRQILLEHLFRLQPDRSFLFEKDEQMAGFCLGRAGSHYHLIGPILARDEQTAYGLFDRIFHQQYYQPTVIDIPAHKKNFQEYLRHIGFRIQRSFLRMQLGNSQLPVCPQTVFASAGPELG